MRTAALTSFVALAAPMLLGAQGGVRGIVVDSSGRPLENASVTMTPRGRWTRTDSSGRFDFSRVENGRYKLHVRKIAYGPAETDVIIAGKPMQFRFILNELVQTLEPVNVTASCPRFQLEGFFCRRRRAGGVFLDAAAIDSAHVRFIPELFQNQPGFSVVPAKIGREIGLAIVSVTGWRCINFVVDGHAGSLPNRNLAWPKDLLGVEIYQSPDSVPPEYSHFVWGTIGRGIPARCSVVVAWSATRPRK